MFSDYYNEIDPGASAWLAELVEDGSLPFGFVDCRVMRLEGYGNAIVPELAALFLRAVRAALEPRGPA